MLRIHFTSHDLARTTIAAHPDPLWEVLLSLHMLQSCDGEPTFGAWRRRTRRSIPRAVAQILGELALPLGYEALAEVDVPSTNPIGRAMREYYQIALAPHWQSIQSCFSLDRAQRTTELANFGVDHLLTNLHPRVVWESPVLYVLDLADADVHLEGRGLQLLPSYFCWGAPKKLPDSERPPRLVYPVRPPPGSLGAADDQDVEASEDPLGALIGRTRATVLGATASRSTTTALAEACNLSVPAASQHAGVLRGAGLIISRRNGRSVLHEITPLGIAMLNRSRDARLSDAQS